MQTPQMVCVFFLKKFSYLLNPPIDFSIGEHGQTNHPDSLLCRYTSRLHLKRLRQNQWLCHSSGSWQLGETAHSNCVTTTSFFSSLFWFYFPFTFFMSSYRSLSKSPGYSFGKSSFLIVVPSPFFFKMCGSPPILPYPLHFPFIYKRLILLKMAPCCLF